MHGKIKKALKIRGVNVKLKKKRAQAVFISGASGSLGQCLAKRLWDRGYSLYLQAHQNFSLLENLQTTFYTEKCSSVYEEEVEALSPFFTSETPSKVDKNFSLDSKYNSQISKKTFPFCHIFKMDLKQEGAGLELWKKIEEKEDELPLIHIHTAAESKIAPMQDFSEEEWRGLQCLHLQNPYFFTQAASRTFLHAKWGRIIFLSSVWGLGGASCEVPYSTHKAGLHGLTKALAKEWAPSGITVNAVASGYFESKMNQGLSEEAKAHLFEEIPMARAGTVEEISSLILYLLSQEAGYLTGQIISPNGAWYC